MTHERAAPSGAAPRSREAAGSSLTSRSFALAVLTHESLASPDIASHFSAATLYSASSLSLLASILASVPFWAALASAWARVIAALASLTQTSLSLPFLSSQRSLATL